MMQADPSNKTNAARTATLREICAPVKYGPKAYDDMMRRYLNLLLYEAKKAGYADLGTMPPCQFEIMRQRLLRYRADICKPYRPRSAPCPMNPITLGGPLD